MMKLKGLRDFLGRKSGARHTRTIEPQDNRIDEAISDEPEHRTEAAPENNAQQEQATTTESVSKTFSNITEQQAETASDDSVQQEQVPTTETAGKTSLNETEQQTETASDDSAQQEQVPTTETVREPAPLIDKEAQTEAKRCLEQVMSQSQGLHGAIVSSIDGNDLLAVLKREMPTNRLSGMTSSLLALGETVARESGQQSCQFVIVENSAGRVVCLRVNRTLMLTCISSLDMSLGMLLSSGRQTADNLGKVIEKGGIKTA